jgi:hypothetical protein
MDTDSFLDACTLLSSQRVNYLVVGGIAMILHGFPRETSDLDILIERTEANANRLLVALNAAGFLTFPPPSGQELLENEVTIYTDLVRELNVHMPTREVSFDEIWRRRIEKRYKGHVLYVASREDLIISKRTFSRPKDLEDLRLLDPGV